MTSKESHILLGKTILSFTLNDDKDSITFDTEDGKITAYCFADCCSYTWIENVELPARGFPAKVQEVGELSMPNLGDLPGRDFVQYYGYKITTNNGDFIIDYRNDSNGYYGGSLEWPTKVG